MSNMYVPNQDRASVASVGIIQNLIYIIIAPWNTAKEDYLSFTVAAIILILSTPYFILAFQKYINSINQNIYGLIDNKDLLVF